MGASTDGFAPISASTASDTVIVASPSAGRSVEVEAFDLLVAAQVTVSFLSIPSSGPAKVIWGPAPVSAPGVVRESRNSRPLFRTDVGDSLGIRLATGVVVGGSARWH